MHSGHPFLVRSVGSVNQDLFLLFLLSQSDRFIPARGSIDLEVARFMLTQKQKGNGDTHALSPSPSPSKKAYKKEMAATLLKNAGAADNNCRILSFNGKSSAVSQASQENVLANLPISRRARRYIPQVRLGFHKKNCSHFH